MQGGCSFDNRASDATSITEGLGMLKAGKLSQDEYRKLEDKALPGCGSCSFLGTANTMCCLAEAMGMSLPGSATIPAVHSARLQAAQATGRQIVTLIEKGINAGQIINQASIENTIRANAAIGGSTNSALHLPAIAYEAGLQLDLGRFEELSRSTPLVARMNPAAAPNVPDFHEAGGMPVVMKQILPLLNGDALTVTTHTVADNVSDAAEPDNIIVRPLSNPWSAEGGLAVLRGNLAPNTAITKPAAIHPDMHRFTGQARCFDSEEEANQAILNGEIVEGEVVVIRYEGPKGGPGMREMYTAMKLLYGRGLAMKTALITDGRFSGTNNGCFVGHISPEAAEGGVLAIVEDGDRITIDVAARDLHLHLDEAEIASRLARWQRPAPRYRRGYLGLYCQLAESADKGGILRIRPVDD
jgi:dihydroxy-acid dehydratase